MRPVPDLVLVVDDPEDVDVIIPGVHQPIELEELPDWPLPLCWVAEGKQRGATGADWVVSVDHGAVPGFYLTGNPVLVDCRACREWMHA